MASTSGKKTSSGKQASSVKKTQTAKKSSRSSTAKSGAVNKNSRNYQAARDSELFREIGLIILFAAMVLLFLCNFGIIGLVGDTISGVLFGLFGVTAYAAPVVLFIAVAFWFANEGSPTAARKLAAGVILFLMAGIVCDLISGTSAGLENYDIRMLYTSSSTGRNAGGCLGGSLSFLLQQYLETIGTVLVVLLCSVVSLILLTEKSLLNGVRESSERLRERSREDAQYRKEAALARREELEESRQQKAQEAREIKLQRAKEAAREKKRREEERRIKEEEKENEKILRMDRKVSGVMIDTSLEKLKTSKRDDIHEITMEDLEDAYSQEEIHEMYSGGSMDPETSASLESSAEDLSTGEAEANVPKALDFEKIRIRCAHQVTMEETQAKEEEQESKVKETIPAPAAEAIRVHSEATAKMRPTAKLPEDYDENRSPEETQIRKEMQNKVPQKYIFPPLSRLNKGTPVTADTTRELKETALRLQQTLNTFGVGVTITDISQGPSVTRYELQPEQGVKVSKIVNLADDIKLNLAATDIRIEAPIPGKAAIGIEVPNKENTPVALRDLLESSQFRNFPSNLAFAVGKDIAGQVVVADIAKMPHMLIAGATGSGKSVCINTLIMSILYKAHPDDVKLIMVDPKVVELSVYNGIPHLLIPVVTDPKKASAALHWGVSEMTDRYQKFADFNVRDLKGYNKKVEAMREQGKEDAPAKLPQIVIIVDELADLMMVSPGEVEESICRLAQLARAAGIHLIIATQRPSVDVITGLIKANMPSRVAFSVSSGVDSRTILDMNGAEKLLGKGDMLFYPQGYSKPARVQGAFVSDKEVADVVDFLKNQAIGNTYAEDVEEQIKSMGSASGGSAGSSGADTRDEYFEEAGRFIIDKDKASIGMLQRVLKIGFNRAARIMDQLAEYGVVGEEEGTKPRKVLMSMEQFEQLLEEI